MDPVDPNKSNYDDEFKMDGIFAEVWVGLQVRFNSCIVKVC